MNALYALYPDPESAQLAVSSLRVLEHAPAARDIVVLSSEPIAEYDLGPEEAKTLMPWLAVVGGLLGGIGGYWLAAFTQQVYPIPTGGMPIVGLWTDGIITFETTMSGAIVFTLLALLASSRLPNWRSKLYDPEVSSGKILVGVVNPPEGSRLELEKTLLEAGAPQVKEFSG